MTWVKQLVDAGAYPKSFATLKLGESHYYFHTNPGALMFPIAQLVHRPRLRAAGQGRPCPQNFPLGIMQFPAVDGGACPECKTLAVGGSYVMYSQEQEQGLRRQDPEFAWPRVENGNKWMEAVLLQTGLQTDPAKIQSIHAPDYFKELQDRNTRRQILHRHAAALHDAASAPTPSTQV